MSKQVIQFNQQEIWCILQALRFVETKDMVERVRLHSTFQQLNLVHYANEFKKSADLDLTTLPLEPIQFEIDDDVADYVYNKMTSTQVKGPYEVSLCIYDISMKLDALRPQKAPPEKT